MDLKVIQDLIKLVKKTEISELTVKEGELTITVKNKVAETVVYSGAASQTVLQTAPAVQQQNVAAQSGTSDSPSSKPADNEFIYRSPMVGTFYRKPGADKDPFVKVGDTVQQGTVLCILEAMKLFNQIDYDGPSGTIVKILADDASPVEFDQPLFLVAKS